MLTITKCSNSNKLQKKNSATSALPQGEELVCYKPDTETGKSMLV